VADPRAVRQRQCTAELGRFEHGVCVVVGDVREHARDGALVRHLEVELVGPRRIMQVELHPVIRRMVVVVIIKFIEGACPAGDGASPVRMRAAQVCD
jgi:hypothetical protein